MTVKMQDDDYIRAAIKQREEELTNRTFAALNEMKIKFPGKSDDEAKVILQSVNIEC